LTTVEAPAPAATAATGPVPHPIRRLVIVRIAFGLLTLFLASVLVFAATQVLPGNAAYAVLGHTATPASLKALSRQMGLDRPAIEQYWSWLTNLLHGNLGNSLVSSQSVATLIGPRVLNSAVLVLFAGVIGTVVGVVLGLIAAVRRDKPLDHVMSIISLAVTSLPEFVIGITLVFIFATNILHAFPAVSNVPPDQKPWQEPAMLVLPVATLVIVIVPYIFRMMRASTIEAMESEYVEMARLKGLPKTSLLVRHALPNAIAPTIQAIGLSFLYLAGGIVLVEVVFQYPGIGYALYTAVLNKDIPIIQFIVLLLAAFYVFMNIVSDVIALLATPRRRVPR
jgi:peptide/nickel transport system permease protein